MFLWDLKLKNKLLERFKGNLIVSCQVFDDEPLNNTIAIGLVAKSVVEGGAKALRLCQILKIHRIFLFSLTTSHLCLYFTCFFCFHFYFDIITKKF